MVGENREEIWHDYLEDGGIDHKVVKHMWLDYSRYHEAKLIEAELYKQDIPLGDIKALDYGCGVGDYGLHLLRAGIMQVDFFDFPRALKLVDYRLQRERGLRHIGDAELIDPDEGQKPKFKDYDLVIFGEVLEHLDNPYQILKECLAVKVKYIFTSSYPYRTDDPDDPYWNNHDHDDRARLMMPECRLLLEENYNYTKFDGELRLWRLG